MVFIRNVFALPLRFQRVEGDFLSFEVDLQQVVYLDYVNLAVYVLVWNRIVVGFVADMALSAYNRGI